LEADARYASTTLDLITANKINELKTRQILLSLIVTANKINKMLFMLLVLLKVSILFQKFRTALHLLHQKKLKRVLRVLA
jgi:hypothetical protein